MAVGPSPAIHSSPSSSSRRALRSTSARANCTSIHLPARDLRFGDGDHLPNVSSVDRQERGAGIFEHCRRRLPHGPCHPVSPEHAVGIPPEIDEQGPAVSAPVLRSTACRDQQGFGEVGAVREVPPHRDMRRDHHVEGEVTLNERTGRLPGWPRADRGRQHEGQTPFAGTELRGVRCHERSAEASRRRCPRCLQTARQFVLQLPPFRSRQAAEQQVAADGASERRIHDRQIQLRQRRDHPFRRAPDSARRDPLRIVHAHADVRQGELHFDRL